MSSPISAAELPLVNNGAEGRSAQQPPAVDRLYRQLRFAGAVPVLPEAAPPQNYVIVPDAGESDEFWSTLWRLRTARQVQTAFAGHVIPQCPLLSAERAKSVVLPVGLQVPSGSAWVAMIVDLPRFARSCGTVDEDILSNALRCCVDIGEQLHDAIKWPTADMRHDSWLNRRLAVVVTGIGTLVASSGNCPDSHDSLRTVNQLLVKVRSTLLERSREIARRSEQLPAITLSDPSHLLPVGGVRDDWQRRWRTSVQASLVRHRNLIALSPWDLFPGTANADIRYAELLPLLRHADLCAFNRSVSIDQWNLNEFKRFHQRAKAVLQHRGATSLIAEHV